MGSRQGFVEITTSKGFSDKIKSALAKYPQAANEAMKTAVFEVEKKAKDELTRIIDGAPINSGAAAGKQIFPKRTLPEGVRFKTGNLAGGIRTRFKEVQGVVTEGAVGINSPYYGVEHERRGRNKERGYYAFLWPSLRESKAKIRKIFDFYLKRAERKAVR